MVLFDVKNVRRHADIRQGSVTERRLHNGMGKRGMDDRKYLISAMKFNYILSLLYSFRPVNVTPCLKENTNTPLSPD